MQFFKYKTIFKRQNNKQNMLNQLAILHISKIDNAKFYSIKETNTISRENKLYNI